MIQITVCITKAQVGIIVAALELVVMDWEGGRRVGHPHSTRVRGEYRLLEITATDQPQQAMRLGLGLRR